MDMKHLFFALIAAAVAASPVSGQQVTKETRDGIKNFSRLETTVACAGAITADAMPEIRKMGFVSVINLREAQEPGAQPEPSRAWERVEEDLARERGRAARGFRRFDHRARVLEQEPELDPRGAGGLARPAADAVVHRFGERGVVGRHLPAIHRAHESDPAAGVGALEGGQRERGTGRQAEPALDATCEPVAVHLEERPARGGCRRRNAQAVASA